MDGNGRWASARRKPRSFGHAKGIEAVRRTVRATIDLGLPFLTLFGFSSENWRRPAAEVEFLMGLLRHYISSEIDELDAAGVRVSMIGDRQRLQSYLVRLIEDAEQRTRENDTLSLTVAISCGARQEITAATRRLAADVAAGRLALENIDGQNFADVLEAKSTPDPDLVIRTSREKRISYFLLWQAAYAELYCTDTLWPDFAPEDLRDAIHKYSRRERRFGAVCDVGSVELAS
jgi:undecaprenyl diphosphate synthase